MEDFESKDKDISCFIRYLFCQCPIYYSLFTKDLLAQFKTKFKRKQFEGNLAGERRLYTQNKHLDIFYM